MIVSLAACRGETLVFGQETATTTSPDKNVTAESQTGGSFFDRPTLTGNWWGARDTLATHGVIFDISFSQFYQGVTQGGNDRDFEYGGKFDYYVTLDGGKAGLLPGFSATTHIETRYGDDINGIDGLFSFGNFNMAFPNGEKADTGVTAFKLTQRLYDHILLIAGKINSLDDFRLNFTSGNGLDRFMNSAVVANIINARTIPYSTYGAGFAVLADQGPEFTFLVRDPDDHATTTDLDRLFAHGALLTASLRIPITPKGLPGTQVIGGNWSSRNHTSLDPSSWANIPGQGLIPVAEKSDSWAVYYNFDQTLWVSSSSTNTWVGVFGMSGLSDGNPNPIRWNATIGLGAGGVIPGRDRDTLGVSYFHLGVSDDFKDLLSGPGAPRVLTQRDEEGVELFYNAALTGWCHLTADLQIVPPSTREFGTTVLIGTRLKIDF
jgi:porin